MALTIDQLQIQIEAESVRATSAIDTLIGRLETLQAKLNVLGSAGKSAGSGLTATANGAKKADTATSKYANTTDKASKSTRSFTDRLAQQISKTRTLYGAFMSVARVFGDWFNESNEYIETVNLFNVTMGEAAPAAREYAKAVEAAMGIDSKDFMQYQGVFKNLTAGFGVVEEDANKMSQNLTQLSYDMASFFNTDVETAFDKLSSAMSGQVKGLREFGIDTTVATLQEYALTQGIEKKVSAMTQAEKALLRYNYIMEKSTHMQGDMARTIITPANALRVLQAQLTRMKRAFGDIISVLATQVIPYVQAFVEIVTEAAKKLATFFGFDPEDFAADTSGIEKNWASAEDEVDDYTESLKKAKKQMMGFDELNIIQNPDSGSSDADAGAGGMGDMGVYEYDFLKDLKTGKLDEVKEKVKDILKWVGLVGTDFAVCKKATGLATGITSIATALKAIQSLPIISFFGKIAFAIQAVAGGAATFGEAFVYVFQGVAGIFSGIVLGIVSIIGYVNNLIDMIKNGENVSNVLGASIAGLGGAGAAFLIAIGVGATVATGGIAALVVGIVAAVGIITAIVINHWDEIKAALSTAWTWLYGTVIKPVVDFFVGVATWFYSHVIKPIADFFAPIFEYIGWKIGLVYSKVAEIVSGIVKAISSIVKKVAEIYLKIAEILVALGKAIYTYVITPVVDFFVMIGKKANEYIFKPIYDGLMWLRDKALAFFKPIVTAVVNFFSDTFKGVINGVLWGIEWTINRFIKMLNGAISLINKIPGVDIQPVDELSIPRLASGGVVDEGQMFIAREAGPELVGSIGRKTAVANNDQIISGIESGVYRAMVAANANGNSGGTQTIRIINEIDGDVVGEKVIKYHNGRVMQTGVSPLLV